MLASCSLSATISRLSGFMDDSVPANIKSSAIRAESAGAPLKRNGQTLMTTFQTSNWQGVASRITATAAVPIGGRFAANPALFVSPTAATPGNRRTLDSVHDRRRQEIKPANLKFRQLHAEINF